MTMFSSFVRWLSAVVMLVKVTNCNGAIKSDSRRRAEFLIHENYLYNDTVPKDEESHEILHAVDFPAQESALDEALTADGEPRGDAASSTKAPKSTKSPKSHEKRRERKGKHPKHPKGTSMPTVSSAPSFMPSISNQPSVSAAPSNSPTVSNQPSISGAPSSVPTVSSEPSISAAPSTKTVAVANGSPNPTSPNPTSPNPTSPNPTSPMPLPPVPVTRVEILNKFALRYTFDNDAVPSDSDYSELAVVTGWYMGNHSANYYDAMAEVFLDTVITSHYAPSPLIVDYDAVSRFAQHSPIPSVEQHDQTIASGFSAPINKRYLSFLRSYLADDNPFSDTESIEYSTYWEALVSQRPTKTTIEQPTVESSSSSAKIYAPIVAVAGMVILVFGAFFVEKERRRRNEANRINNHRWDEHGSNLAIDDGKPIASVEGDTIILDGPSSGSSSDENSPPSSPVAHDHSYVPTHTATSPLSTVYEGSDDGAILMSDESQSPSEVMRELNLSSALEDVDLEDTETGGVADLPGRHDSWGIGELPEKPQTQVFI